MFASFVLGFVAQDQTNMSADGLGVGINKPFREMLGPAALYICLLDPLHFDGSTGGCLLALATANRINSRREPATNITSPKPKSSQAEGLVIVARAKCSVSVEATPPFKIKSG